MGLRSGLYGGGGGGGDRTSIPASSSSAVTCSSWWMEQLSMTTIDHMFGIRDPLTKSKKVSPLTESVIMYTSTTPVDDIAAMDDTLFPLTINL